MDGKDLVKQTLDQSPQANSNAKRIVGLVKESGRVTGYQLSDNSRKLKDYGNPDPNPNADSKNESHMAKTTLGGMAAGAATGATIGSVVPIVGTAFGALAGSVVGAVGGAFVGLFTKSK